MSTNPEVHVVSQPMKFFTSMTTFHNLKISGALSAMGRQPGLQPWDLPEPRRPWLRSSPVSPKCHTSCIWMESFTSFGLQKHSKNTFGVALEVQRNGVLLGPHVPGVLRFVSSCRQAPTSVKKVFFMYFRNYMVDWLTFALDIIWHLALITRTRGTQGSASSSLLAFMGLT